jgi:glycerol uptake facilitator-like aquaporin
LDIFFLAFISGASMNPARSLAPALLSIENQNWELGLKKMINQGLIGKYNKQKLMPEMVC